MSRPFSRMRVSQRTVTLLIGSALSLSLLSACDENGKFNLSAPQAEGASAGATSRSTKLVERDVEAPEVFSVTDQGLWDGRPSLGGVWVAHPDVTDPERVIIRNESNGKFVIGALFRRERDLPGPKLQISSDAAAALNILAGAPAPLNVTALRREEAEAETPETPTEAAAIKAPSDVAETTLDPIAAAGAAIDNPSPAPATAPKPAPSSSLDKPFVQIGIFSVEANATRAAKQMSGAGMVPTVKKSTINGKAFWRVVVGPASSSTEMSRLTKSIKSEGFTDAYAVSN